MNLPYKGKVRLTSIQGLRWGKPHRGIDLVGNDKKIYAIKSGIVVVSNMIPKESGKIEWQFGNRIMVKNEDGIYLTYQHLSERHVEKGEKITEEQQIGIEGGTGNCVPEGASHLHIQAQNKQGTGFREYKIADYLGIPNSAGTYESVEKSILVMMKCGISQNAINYLKGYTYQKEMFSRLWSILWRSNKMPAGRGNPNADLATAIARKCNFSGTTMKYIWSYTNKETVQKEILIPLWYNMQ